MHDFLRAIGFQSIRTKKQLKLLIDWVLERPDTLSVVSKDSESNLAQASREICGHAGVSVVGEIDERGNIIPEYYFPYIISNQISSEAPLSYEKQSDKDGYVAMCEDMRLGMSMIFSVRNVTEVMKQEEDFGLGLGFQKVSLSALAKDGRVLLPVDETQPPKNIQDADVYSVVNTFFMPCGMECDQYYLMGKILSKQIYQNGITKEIFYRLIVEANGISMCVAINEHDLEGVPEVGYRIKCHVWLTGDLKN